MKAIRLSIPDVVVIEPRVFGDERRFFFESYNEKAFAEAVGRQVVFVQDNHSKSGAGVLRGLHYQMPPKAQGKLVRVVHGTVFDVAVDIRRGSPSFGRWVGATLSAENKRQMWIPEGFAHGFLSLGDEVEFLYKTTDYYSPPDERCIAWDDPDLAIDWPLAQLPTQTLALSETDRRGVRFTDAELP